MNFSSVFYAVPRTIKIDFQFDSTRLISDEGHRDSLQGPTVAQFRLMITTCSIKKKIGIME